MKRQNKKSGDNRPVEAAAVAYSNKQSFPQKLQKSRRIQNSELVGSVTGSVAFSAAQKYYLNPGLPATFPWLSVTAAQWQQYRFHKLRFRYVTRTSTALLGSVILSPDYNPVELTPSSEQQASNTQDVVEDVIWKELCCVLDVNAMFPVGPRKQVRTAAVAGDISIYDAGRMFVCVTGEADASAIGKLWVDYDVELFVPQNSSAFSLGPTQTSMFTIGSAQTLTTTVPTVVDVDELVYDPLGIGSSAAGVFTPPAGTYLVSGYMAFNDSANENFSAVLTVFKNGAALRTESSSARMTISGASTGDSVTLPISDIVTCNGTDTVSFVATLTGAAGTLTVTQTGVSLIWKLA